jgi:uncharacterized protein YbjT (DUF2867 family)
VSTYVIAGVTGRVGGVVASELLARGQEVRGIVRDAARAAQWAASGGEPAVGSLDDAEFLARTLRGAVGFFVLLPEDPFAADFRGGRRAMADAIVTSVRESGVPHVVVLSAVAASVEDGNGPAKDLHYLERAIRKSAARVTVIRASWFQENVGAALGAAQQAGIYPNMMASADVAFPTVATRDVGRVAAALLLSPPLTSEVIDVVGPSYSVRELATALGTTLGKELQVVDIPGPARQDVLVQAGLPASFAAEVAELYGCFESGRLRPEGDRMLSGPTRVEEVLPGLVGR